MPLCMRAFAAAELRRRQFVVGSFRVQFRPAIPFIFSRTLHGRT